MEHQGGVVSFRTDDGIELPAVTAEEMRDVDRVAMNEFGLGVLQMMENAGRTLAMHAMEMLSEGAGRVAELIVIANQSGGRILSLDVPSGVNAITGDALGRAIRPERTLTLALPKTGLARVAGELYVADIGIPLAVYERLSIVVQPFFRGRYSVRVSFAG